MTDTVTTLSLTTDAKAIKNQLLDAMKKRKFFQVLCTGMVDGSSENLEVDAVSLATNFNYLKYAVENFNAGALPIVNCEDSDWGQVITDMFLVMNDADVALLKQSIQTALQLIQLTTLEDCNRFCTIMKEQRFAVRNIASDLRACFDVEENPDLGEDEQPIPFRWNPSAKLAIYTDYLQDGKIMANLDFYVNSKHTSEKWYVPLELTQEDLLAIVAMQNHFIILWQIKCVVVCC